MSRYLPRPTAPLALLAIAGVCVGVAVAGACWWVVGVLTSGGRR